MIYYGLSDEDLHTITDGCASERQGLVERIKKSQETMDRIARDLEAELNSGMTREELGGLP
jgi:hypothetical protein